MKMLSVIFSACTRLRRLFLLLPEALGATQPDCLALVHAHFAAWCASGMKGARSSPGAGAQTIVCAPPSFRACAAT